MSYGQKPTNAWARQAPQITPGPNVFTSQALGLAAGQPFGGMAPMPGMPSINALVNQAAFSNMNVLAAQRPHIIQQQVAPQQQQRQPMQPEKNQRTFVGTITKLMETYGFVDDDVFFQTTVIRGAAPQVGDRVMVEAAFNPNMPFKWNAFRIQLIHQDVSKQKQGQQSHQQQQHPPQAQIRSNQSNGGGMGGGPTRWQRGDRGNMGERKQFQRRSPQRAEMQARRVSPPIQRSPTRRASPKRFSPARKAEPTKRTASDRDRSPPSIREIARTRSPTSSKRDDSPPRRRQRIIPRYLCSLPKHVIPRPEMKYIDFHKRYESLYIPSDFIRCEMSWLDSIRLEDPLKLSPHPITFNVLNKDIDVLLDEGDSLPLENPPDADSRYVVKVLLLSHPGTNTLHQKMFGLLTDGSLDESVETQPIAKNLQLLVGIRNKDFMAIGGAWSPSLDGPNPTDPQTMIKTAIRTTKALTGIDLSNCPRWYKMLHLLYHRAERSRTDNVVLMLPDTSSTPELMPSPEIYFKIKERIMKQLADKLAAIDAEEFLVESKESEESTAAEDAAHPATTVETAANGTAVVGGASSQDSAAGQKTGPSELTTAGASQPDEQQAEESQMSLNETTNSDEAPDATGTAAQSSGPKTKAHWSKLNVKAMKVAELREELELRGLDAKGIKNVLAQRLQDAVEKEKLADPQPIQQEVAQNAENPVTQVQEKTEPVPFVVQIKEELVELMETDEAVGDKDENTEEPMEKVDQQSAEELEKQRKELEKAKEKFEKDKQDRKTSLERHYKIPEEPCVLVYPSKTAKAGKFECKTCSLSALLDYRQEDNKESSFEVFLFSEALKESFDRLNAFSIYHSIATAPERDAANKNCTDALLEALAQEKEKQKEEDSDVQVLSEEGPDVKKPDEPPKEDPRKSFKALVYDTEIFSAFAYFDSNVCGYILDKDLEEIIYSIGLDLSRGEIQRTVKKLSARDKINYRNLTDKWVNKDGEIKHIPSTKNDLRSKNDLLKGLIDEQIEANHLDSTPQSTNSGVVFYKGSVYNIQQSIEQYALVDKERAETLLKNEQLDSQLKTMKEQRDQLEKKKRRLDEDLDRYKKKLHTAEKSIKAKDDDANKMKSSLQDSKRYAERIIGLVDKLFPPPPPKKEEKEVLVLVETDDASAKKCEKTEDGNKPTRASSCQPFTE